MGDTYSTGASRSCSKKKRSYDALFGSNFVFNCSGALLFRRRKIAGGIFKRPYLSRFGRHRSVFGSLHKTRPQDCERAANRELTKSDMFVSLVHLVNFP